MHVIDMLLHKIKGKKIIAYGAGVTGLAFLSDAERVGIEVAYVCDGNTGKQGKTVMGKMIRNPYDLIYEDKYDVAVVVCAPGGVDVIVQNLLKMGFEESAIHTDYCARNACDHADALLGISRGKESIINLCEGKNECGRKILILGGSTSDPSYDGIKSWSWFLQKKIDANQCDAAVYNGAVVGYASAQELLCLLRDGLNIKPDIVISFTGYNDYAPSMDLMAGGRYSLVGRNLHDYHEKMIRHYKEHYEKGDTILPMYYGEKEKDSFDSFVTNLRMMNAVCNEFGINYYALFQPMIKNEKVMPGSFAAKMLEDSLIQSCVERFDRFYSKFLKIYENYPFMIDFTSVFQEESDLFIDTCHVTEHGNELVAEAVYKLLFHDKKWEKSNEVQAV